MNYLIIVPNTLLICRLLNFAAIYKFVINKIANFYFQNGTITLSGEVDREQRDTYTLIVLAKDNAEIDSRQVKNQLYSVRNNCYLPEPIVCFQYLIRWIAVKSN